MDMKKWLENAKTELRAWESVKRVYKKDGKPFAQLGKNFEGLNIIKNNYGDIELNCKGYQISTRFLLENYENIFGKELEDKTRVIKEVCLKPYLYLNCEESWELIQHKKQKLKNYIESLERDIVVFETVKKDIEIKINELSENIKQYRNTNFYYILNELVRNNF